MNTLSELLAVFVLRCIQAALLSLPTLLFGLLVAGALRAVVGRQNVLAALDRARASDLLRAYALAFFLPVCSLGVVPVLATLRAMGVRWGVVIVFAIGAPLTTPWALGYLLDRCGPLAAALLILSNALIALAAGFVVDRHGPGQRADVAVHDGVTEFPYPLRILNVLWAAGRSLDGTSLKVICAGLLGVGLLAVCIPPNAVGEWLVERTLPHAAVLSLVSLLSHVTPELAALQAGEIVNASLLPGMLIPLIGVGACVHLGTILAAFRALRVRQCIKMLAAVLVITVATTFVADLTLRQNGYAPEDSHAFEDYGRPFHLLDHPDGVVAGFAHRIGRSAGPHSAAAAVAIGAVILVGRFGKQRNRPNADDASDAVMSRKRLKLIFATVVVGTGLTTTYTYFPPPAHVARELRAASADFSVACRQQDTNTVQRSAAQIDRRLSQLPITLYLHGQPPTLDQRRQIKTLRTAMASASTAATEGRLPYENVMDVMSAMKALLRTFEMD